MNIHEEYPYIFIWRKCLKKATLKRVPKASHLNAQCFPSDFILLFSLSVEFVFLFYKLFFHFREFRRQKNPTSPWSDNWDRELFFVTFIPYFRLQWIAQIAIHISRWTKQNQKIIADAHRCNFECNKDYKFVDFGSR